MTRPFNEFDVALDALEDAYRNRMAVVMAGLVASASPEVHREWLADAALCLAQFASVSDWIAHQTEIVLLQSTPASAA
jgi:hypothetical protein